MIHRTLLVSLLAALPFGLWAGWIPTEGGTYDYNDEANWEGGTKDGVFSATLTGDQTITFSADTSLENGLTIAYGGNYALTFVSDGTGAKTLTLGGDISVDVSKNGAAAHVTFGSATAEQNLVIDLGGAKRTITAAATQDDPGKIGHLKLYATLANGSAEYAGKGTIKVYGTNTYADGTALSNTGYIYLNSDSAFGTGLVTIENDASAWPRIHGDVATRIANDWLLKGKFGFHGSYAMEWLGVLTIPDPVVFMCESANLTISSPKIVLGDVDDTCAIGNFQKFGSRTLTMNTALTVNGTEITMGDGVWNFNGKISGENGLTFSGPTGNGYVYLKSPENDFTGEVTVEGTSTRSISLCLAVEGSLPEGVTKIRLGEHGVLQSSSAYSCESFLTSGLIDTASTGLLCTGVANETGTLDFTNYPDLGFGASGGNLTFKGTIIPGANGYLIGGGPSYLTLGAANALSGAHDAVFKGGNVYVIDRCDLSGTVTVQSGTLELNNATGSMPDAEIVVEAGATVKFGSGIACEEEVQRAKKVTLLAGSLYFSGHKSYVVKHYLPELVLDAMPGAGGTSQMAWSTKDSKWTLLHIGKITRPTFAFLNFSDGGAIGTKALAPDSNVWHILVDSGVEALGGVDGVATATPVVPWVRKGGTGFVTYTVERGFRFLDSANEVQSYTAAALMAGPTASGENALFSSSAGGTLEFTGEESTLTSFAFGYQGKSMYFTSPNGKVNVTSGAVTCDGNAKPYLSANIDFGANRGYIIERQGKGQNVSGALSGSGGLTIANWSTGNNVSSGGTGLECAFKNSTFTGDVHIFDRVDSVQDGCFPSGERSGNTYLHGYWLCGNYNISLNGLYGEGYLQLGNGYNITFTLGCDGSDGDFGGRVNRTNGTLGFTKVGAGRQRFSGDCNHNGATTVEEGVFQNDGSFSGSAATVKSGATLAGSGSFAKLVTLEDGARLEAGSTNVEDQVLNLDGGLTLQGDATLTVLGKGRDTLGSVALGGTLTIPEGKVITVRVDADKLRRDATYTILTSSETLSRANFRRGYGCGHLSLGEDGMSLLMSPAGGMTVVLR